MDTWQLLIWVLAVTQMVEIWHHSVLMARLRAEIETRPGFIADLASCPFCLSVWVSLYVVGSWFLALLCDEPWRSLLLLPILALAVSRGANLLNDVTHSRCRTPRI